MRARAIDHVAVVVEDLEAARRVYEALGFEESFRERVDEQGVEIVGMRAGDGTIELLRPTKDASALVRYRGDKASRLHHIAYRVDDIQAELARLKTLGMKLIDERPRRGARGNLIAFIHPSDTAGVLIEICQPP